MATRESDADRATIFYDAVEEVLSQILSKSPIYSHLFGPSDHSCLELLRSESSSLPGHLTFRFRSASPPSPQPREVELDRVQQEAEIPKKDEADKENGKDTLQDHHLNSHRVLHGSVSCTLVDLISGVCIASLGSGSKTFHPLAPPATTITSSPPIVPFTPPTSTSAQSPTQPASQASIHPHPIWYPTRQEILSTPRGLSTDLSLQFTSAARKGEEVWVKTWVKKKGRKLVWVGVQVWARQRSGEEDQEMKLVVEGSHTKYIK